MSAAARKSAKIARRDGTDDELDEEFARSTAERER
jgi:hypothetical protein